MIDLYAHRQFRRNGRRFFTLVEVVVALGILSVSLATLFQMTTSARSKLTKAEESWENIHKISQAAEYVLLHASDLEDISIPEDFFPYEDYEVNISYEEVTDEQIPEEYYDIDTQLPLELCVIELVHLTPSGKQVVETLYIERIIYDDAGLVPEN